LAGIGPPLLIVMERSGDDAVSLRFTNWTARSRAMRTGTSRVIILPQIVGALLASTTPMV